MSRTTDQWQKLLEGATPGPWTGIVEYHTENEGGDFSIDARIIANYEGGEDPLMFAQDSMVWQRDENIHLGAAAPEAVAEVVRLRRELEALRGEMDRKARLSSVFGTSGYAEVSFRSSLTRILNGETNV